MKIIYVPTLYYGGERGGSNKDVVSMCYAFFAWTAQASCLCMNCKLTPLEHLKEFCNYKKNTLKSWCHTIVQPILIIGIFFIFSILNLLLAKNEYSSVPCYCFIVSLCYILFLFIEFKAKKKWLKNNTEKIIHIHFFCTSTWPDTDRHRCAAFCPISCRILYLFQRIWCHSIFYVIDRCLLIC